MRVAISNDSGIRIPAAGIRRLAVFFLEQAAGGSGRRWSEVSLVLANDEQIQPVNRSFLGHDYPTDVISFTYPAIPGEETSLVSGEMIINAAMAIRLGRRYGGASRELALYIAHGCDHLAGADDNTPLRRRRMRNRELAWIRQAKAAGLLPRLLTE